MHTGDQTAGPLSFTITAAQLAELADLAGKLHEEAELCREAGRWTAALILLGGSAEAALLATACVFEPELRALNLWHPRDDDPTTWTLGQLGNIAREAGWLPTRPAPATGKAATRQAADTRSEEDMFADLDGEAGDALRFVQRLRNMIVHPGAYLREPIRPDTSNNDHMSQTYELMDGIIALIFDHLTTQMNTLPG